MRWATLATPLVVLLPAALVSAPPAFAAEPESGLIAQAPAGQRSSAIPYYNAAPRSAKFVDRAVRAWNRARVGTHFVAVPRDDARVVIRAGAPRTHCNGLAKIRNSQASRTRDTPIRYGYGRSATVTLGENCPLPLVRALVAAHELGHVLGLNHERRRCSVMSPRAEFLNSTTLKPFPGCSPRTWARLQRDLLADADVRAVRALYGDQSTGDVTPSASKEASPSASEGPSLSPIGWAAIALLGVAAAGALAAALTSLRRR